MYHVLNSFSFYFPKYVVTIYLQTDIRYKYVSSILHAVFVSAFKCFEENQKKKLIRSKKERFSN